MHHGTVPDDAGTKSSVGTVDWTGCLEEEEVEGVVVTEDGEEVAWLMYAPNAVKAPARTTPTVVMMATKTGRLRSGGGVWGVGAFG